MLPDSGIADTDLYLTLASQAPLTSGFDPDLVRLALLLAAAAVCDDTDRADRILADASRLLDPALDGVSRLTRADLPRPTLRGHLLGFASQLAAALHTAPFQVPPGQPVPDASLRFLARALDACCMGSWLPGVWGSAAGRLLLSRVHGWRFSLAAQLGEHIHEPVPFHPRVRVLPERGHGHRRRRGGGPDGPCRPQQGPDFGGPQ